MFANDIAAADRAKADGAGLTRAVVALVIVNGGLIQADAARLGGGLAQA